MKTSKKDFEEFKKYFLLYQEKLGCKNYEIIFENVAIEENDAELEYYREPCAAIVRLNTQLAPLGRSMELLAKHEAIELLLAPLRSLASKRIVLDDEVNEKFHNVVQALMRVVDEIH